MLICALTMVASARGAIAIVTILMYVPFVVSACSFRCIPNPYRPYPWVLIALKPACRNSSPFWNLSSYLHVEAHQSFQPAVLLFKNSTQ